MKNKKNYFIIITLIFLWSCTPKQKDDKSNVNSKKVQRPVAVDNGKIFIKNGEKLLYGGEDSTSHFFINNCSLNDSQFHYGIGREKFPALLNPEFISVNEADSIWNDTNRFLLAYAGEDIKAYSVKDLIRHEVVNDVLNNKPIMAVYCVLADLGAIYERSYGGSELTFALSGYTYYDHQVWNGLDGFVLWDRETESLWWPLIGEAVSGKLKGVQLQEMKESSWKDMTWKELKSEYPTARVLKSGQEFERPENWQRYNDVSDIVSGFS